jgi:predicted transcriptional regulator of viral defense system
VPALAGAPPSLHTSHTERTSRGNLEGVTGGNAAYRHSGGSHPDRRLAGLASRQHGMVTHRQLAALGIRGSAVTRRIASGRLERVYKGVFAVGHRQRTPEARWIAAVMACGTGAVLSHFDAAALWRIYDGSGARVHVTTTRSVRKRPGILPHQVRRLDEADVTEKRGIPVTTVARTLVDLTDLLGRDRVLRAMREAEYLKLLDLDALAGAVRRAHGRRRLGVLTQAIARHRPGQIVREELEHRFQELLDAAGLPEPATNVIVPTRRRNYRVDCLWRHEGVAVELDEPATPRSAPRVCAR